MKNSVIVLFIVLVAGLIGCNKDENSNVPDSIVTGSTITTSFTGKVYTSEGQVLSGVNIAIGNKSAITDANGVYNVVDVVVDKRRAIIVAEKSGYWAQNAGMIAIDGTINYVDLRMYIDNKLQSFNGTSGGTVTLTGGTSITFPANAIVTAAGNPYTGNVRVTAHEISTADTLFSKKFPGRDLLARDVAGNTSILMSYGMAGAKLYDMAGNPLMIMSGKSATIRFPIAANQQSSAPATIQLWHFDENLTLWVEEGTAIKNGTYYEGAVTHFSWWNCDIPSEYATLNMNITGCQGLPLDNEEVRIQWGSTSTSGVTGPTGDCSGLIPANAVLTVTCRQQGFATIDTVFSIGPFTQGSNNSINISLPNVNCNRAIIGLTDCNGNTLNGGATIYYNNALLGYFSTQGGVINLSNILPGTYVINSQSGFLTSIDTVIVSTSTPLPINLSIQLCDSVQASTNELIMSISPVPFIGTMNLNLSIIAARYKIVNGYEVIELVLRDLVSLDSSHLQVSTPGYVPGLFSWNTTSCTVAGYVVSNFQYISIQSEQGSTNLISTPLLGQNFTGSFSGLMRISMGGTLVVSNVTASFSGVRTQ